MKAKYILLVLIFYTTILNAKVIVPSIFSDNMLLQQKKEINIWGKADAGEEVSVSFCGQYKTTICRDGNWFITLKPIKYGGPFEMTISGKDNRILIKNILVGEVWLAGGQSNMQFTLSRDKNKEDALVYADDPKIRIYISTYNGSMTPQFDNLGKWVESTRNSVLYSHAVAYYYAQELRQKLDIPVGIIQVAIGGSNIQAWMSNESLNADKALMAFAPTRESINAYNKKIELGEAELKSNANATKLFYLGNTALYNGILLPVMPFSIKGAIWYQGEANSKPKEAALYKKLFPAMILCWREGFKDRNLPFIFVQLPAFRAPQDRDWPMLREAQKYTLNTVKNTGMAVSIDWGEENDIHPPYKKPIGYRLSLIALNKVYGKSKIVCSAPTYKRLTIKENRVILHFDNLNEGLKAKDGVLNDFVICGENHQFVEAKALIKGYTIEVYADGIASPVAVRYGWKDWFTPTLFGQDNLPVAPFRTDAF